MPRILHTSDIHIGKSFEQMGNFGKQLRGQIRETCRRVFELASAERVDAVLLAGDVFDSDRIAQADFRFFMERVSSIRPIPVFFLPGTWTHDSFHQKHIYRSRHFLQDKPENLTVFTKDSVETFLAASGRLAIHGRAVLPDSGNPLDGIMLTPGASHNVAVLHTGVFLPQVPESPGKCVLKREHVEACGLDYIAMGDWHTFRRYFDELRTVVQYSGSPETLRFDDGEGSGFVALVSFGEGLAEVKRRKVGHYSWKILDVAWETIGSVQRLKHEVERFADPSCILRVSIEGTIAEKEVIDWERLREELSSRFAYLDLDVEKVRTEIPFQEIENDYRENTVERAFVDLIREELSHAHDPETAQKLREALRRGHALFQGHEEVVS